MQDNKTAIAKFLSTLSVRRATGTRAEVDHGGKISIHALREESDRWETGEKQPTLISIHALREESDDRATT